MSAPSSVGGTAALGLQPDLLLGADLSPAPAQAGHGFVPPSLGKQPWNLEAAESTEERCPKGKGPALFGWATSELQEKT